MSLPPPSAPRTHAHTRGVRLEGYKRADGLWDLDAHLADTKPQDFKLASGVRPAGAAIHEMHIRLTIDAHFNVVDAVASTDAMPYPGHCDEVTPDYRKLVGLNLMHGFRKAVKELLGGVRGCSHLTELLGHFPTLALQTYAGERKDTEDRGGKPFQLDRCHALETSGEAVRLYYPKWFRGAKTGSE